VLPRLRLEPLHDDTLCHAPTRSTSLSAVAQVVGTPNALIYKTNGGLPRWRRRGRYGAETATKIL